jgi:hypothetical protein
MHPKRPDQKHLKLLRIVLLQALLALLAGCAESPEKSASTDPWAGITLPGLLKPEAQSSPEKNGAVRQGNQISTTQSNNLFRSRDDQEQTLTLLPKSVRDRAGWAEAIDTAFSDLGIPKTKENLCATMAIIEQESNFDADPRVSGLPRIVRDEMTKKMRQLGIPESVLTLALTMKSPTGATYAERIDRLQTENDLNLLYRDMTSEIPLGRRLLEGHNPVRTGGPMQVSVKFAEAKAKETPYPYPSDRSIREELFSRRGGVYFGVAYLLDYPADYDRMLYRFGDFNAGHYASRNAAFQAAISRLTGSTIAIDGDLLRYDGGAIDDEPSETQQKVLALAQALELTEATIRDDLRQEKEPSFTETALYTAVSRLAIEQGKPLEKAQLPEIRLHSPKITSRLTTAKFAQRVDERYHRCLDRGP